MLYLKDEFYFFAEQLQQHTKVKLIFNSINVGNPCKNYLHGEKSTQLSEFAPALRWDFT